MPTLSAFTSPHEHQEPAAGGGCDYAQQLEQATRALLELNAAVLDEMDKTVGIASLRALQTLERLGPIMVTQLGNDLGMLVSTASRLSDRLTEAGLITRQVAPTNRRATLLELSDQGRDVLARLTNARVAALHAVTEHMTHPQRQALLTGARAFTHARRPAQSHRDPADTP